MPQFKARLVPCFLALVFLLGACAMNRQALYQPVGGGQGRQFELGANIHLNAGPAVDQLKAMGASWVRMDMNWVDLEPQPGVWNFEPTDAVLARAHQAGLKVYATLAYAPAWARTGETIYDVPSKQAWQHFVKIVAARYGGQVAAFGIWNEPNLDDFWKGSAQQYVEVLLKPAYKILKARDPGLVVAGPELAHLYSASIGVPKFLRVLKNLGGEKYFDVFSHHVYAASQSEFENKLLGYRAGGVLYRRGLAQMLKSAGLGPKPVWITELGADSRELGEEGQAKLLEKQLRFLSGLPWVEKAFVYELQDGNDHVPQWGLLRASGELKPAYLRLREMIKDKFKLPSKK